MSSKVKSWELVSSSLEALRQRGRGKTARDSRGTSSAASARDQTRRMVGPARFELATSAFSIFLRPEIAGDSGCLFRILIRRREAPRRTAPPARGASPAAGAPPGDSLLPARGILPGVKSPLSLYLLGPYLATTWRPIVALRWRLARAQNGRQRRVREPRVALDRAAIAVAQVALEEPALGGGFRHRARIYRPLGQARPRVAFRGSRLAREPELRNTLQRRRCAAKARASSRRGLVPLGASAACGTDFRFAVFFCAAFFFARGLLLWFRAFFLPAISACPPGAQDRAFPAAGEGVAPAPAAVTLSGRRAARR